VASACRAFEPPPPETAALTTSTPGAVAVTPLNSVSRAADSEPEVHQEKTSRLPGPDSPPPPVDPAPPQAARERAAAAAVTAVRSLVGRSIV
jgi:hypothetical protein